MDIGSGGWKKYEHTPGQPYRHQRGSPGTRADARDLQTDREVVLEEEITGLKKQNKSLRYIVRLMERKILELTGHPAAALSVALAKQSGPYKMNKQVFELLKESERGVNRMQRMENERKGEDGVAG
eukprot:g5584.t1